MLIGEEDMYHKSPYFTSSVKCISENAKVFYANSQLVLDLIMKTENKELIYKLKESVNNKLNKIKATINSNKSFIKLSKDYCNEIDMDTKLIDAVNENDQDCEGMKPKIGHYFIDRLTDKIKHRTKAIYSPEVHTKNYLDLKSELAICDNFGGSYLFGSHTDNHSNKIEEKSRNDDHSKEIVNTSPIKAVNKTNQLISRIDKDKIANLIKQKLSKISKQITSSMSADLNEVSTNPQNSQIFLSNEKREANTTNIKRRNCELSKLNLKSDGKLTKRSHFNDTFNSNDTRDQESTQERKPIRSRVSFIKIDSSSNAEVLNSPMSSKICINSKDRLKIFNTERKSEQDNQSCLLTNRLQSQVTERGINSILRRRGQHQFSPENRHIPSNKELLIERSIFRINSTAYEDNHFKQACMFSKSSVSGSVSSSNRKSESSRFILSSRRKNRIMFINKEDEISPILSKQIDTSSKMERNISNNKHNSINKKEFQMKITQKNESKKRCNGKTFSKYDIVRVLNSILPINNKL